jgi:hypothetical protein
MTKEARSLREDLVWLADACQARARFTEEEALMRVPREERVGPLWTRECELASETTGFGYLARLAAGQPIYGRDISLLKASSLVVSP